MTYYPPDIETPHTPKDISSPLHQALNKVVDYQHFESGVHRTGEEWKTVFDHITTLIDDYLNPDVGTIINTQLDTVASNKNRVG